MEMPLLATSTTIRPFGNSNSTNTGTRRSRAVAQRAVTTASTCGYANGDPANPRTANSGFDCRVDADQGLWGFCPTTVISASDCGLAGACVDQGACSSGCGKTQSTELTTFTW
ncbi:hypothetical protein GGR56DRAFT_662208 [Xylariaceae sp. FL0804]|nr:hypothetical protein GGR56DRAFT_662208 [Xylariaceae sp. FL0804]